MCAWVGRKVRRRGKDDEGGFVLLESLISISLLTVIMAALTTFFITASDSTASERARQTAVQLSDTEMDLLHGIEPGDLPLGRSSALANAQFAAASSTVSPWLTTMNAATDTTTTTLTVPMSVTTTVAGTTYTTANYLGWCYLPTNPSVGTDCTNTAAASSAGIKYLRAVVSVVWSARGCPSRTCTYVNATLLSTADDPTFALNQAAPAAPIVSNPGHQASAVNDTVSLQLSTQTNTGVAPFTWQVSGLPAGLTMSTTGLITGKPTTTVTNQTVTVTVTDAFLRTDTGTFTWTILPDLVPTDPGTQTSYLNTAINPLTLTASGGSNGPFTWTDPQGTLPPGLSLSSGGVVTGTPTTLGSYTVKLTVADSSGRTRTVTFTWNVTYAPLSANPGNQTNTVNQSVGTVIFTASGGSGNYVWTDPNGTLPPGLSLSTSGVVTGTPTTVGTYSVNLLVTDATLGSTTHATFTWFIGGGASISGLTSPFSTTVGATIANQALTYVCSTSNCTFTISGAPSGIGLSKTTAGPFTASVTVTNTGGTIYLGGTVGGSAGSYTVKVTPVDNVTSTTGAAPTSDWTVRGKPTLSGLITLKTSVGATIANQALTYTCPSSDCTYSVTAGPSGIGLATTQTGSPQTSVTVSNTSGTIYLRGTIAASTPTGNNTVTLSAADNTTNAPATTATSTWNLLPPMVIGAPGPVTTASGTSASNASSYTCQYSTCTMTVSGQPGGIGIGLTSRTNPNNNLSVSVSAGTGTIYVSGKVTNNSAGTYLVTVTITDAAGSYVTNSAYWYVVA
jgi:hypothetical protein